MCALTKEVSSSSFIFIHQPRNNNVGLREIMWSFPSATVVNNPKKVVFCHIFNVDKIDENWWKAIYSFVKMSF